MSLVRTSVVCLLLACLLVPQAAAPPAEARPPVGEMIQAINRFRAHQGLSRLRASDSLNRSARSYGWRMIRRGYFGHSPRGIQASRRFRALGEVLEWHTPSRAKVRRTLRVWKHSPGHRRVLLDSRFRYVGGGFVRGHFRGHRAGVWVVQVGG